LRGGELSSPRAETIKPFSTGSNPVLTTKKIKVMKAYQVHSGEENKHGFQDYELQATYLSVSETPLYGDVVTDSGWGTNGKYRRWTAHGWNIVCICRIEEIEIVE